MKVLFFTGKGGVGKSTLACATALAVSEQKRTLLFSLDLAHNLRDIIGKVKSNVLEVLEVDPQDEIEKRWTSIRSFYRGFAEEKGITDIEAEEFLLIPGLEDILLLLALCDAIEDEYEVIVIDGPPTASTLRLLSIPSSIEWFMEKTFRKMVKRYLRVRRVLEKYFGTSLPSEGVIEEIEEGYQRILKLSHILKNPDVTAFRLVSLPSAIALKETGRLFTTLSLFEYPCDMLIINRIRDGAENMVDEFRKAFPFMEVKTVSDYETEPKGELLLKLSNELYKGMSPEIINSKVSPLIFSTRKGRIMFKLRAPCMSSGEFEIWTSDEGLIIKTGSFKRLVPLPHAVNMEIEKASFRKGLIEVTLKNV